MKKTLLISTILCLLLIVFSQITSLAQNENSTVTPSPTETPSQMSSESQKIEVLQAQNILMREYHERIMDTIYFALGTLAVVVLLVVGLGWYTNFKVYKNDVDKIRRELIDDLEKSKTLFKIEMREVATQAGQSAVKDSIREIKVLQYEMLLIEAKQWEEKGIVSNQLYAYSRAIPFALDAHPELRIPEILDNMLEIFDKKKVLLRSSVTAQISRILDTIPKEYSTDVEVIKQHIISLKSKRSIDEKSTE